MHLRGGLSGLLLSLFAIPLFAQPQASAPSSNQALKSDGEAFVIEHEATRVTGQEDGNYVQDVAARIQVQSEAGVKAFAVLSFTYTSSNQAVEVVYVRVHKPNGGCL